MKCVNIKKNPNLLIQLDSSVVFVAHNFSIRHVWTQKKIFRYFATVIVCHELIIYCRRLFNFPGIMCQFPSMKKKPSVCFVNEKQTLNQQN